MPLDLWSTFVDDSAPELLAGLDGQTVQRPDVLTVILNRSDIAVKAHFQVVLIRPGSRRYNKESAGRGNRARMTKARDGGLPDNVRAALSTPGRGQRHRIRNTGGSPSTKLRPVARRSAVLGIQERRKTQKNQSQVSHGQSGQAGFDESILLHHNPMAGPEEIRLSRHEAEIRVCQLDIASQRMLSARRMPQHFHGDCHCTRSEDI